MKGYLSLKSVNCLPNDKILDCSSKLKAFADNKINVTKELKLVLGREENVVGKEKMLVTNQMLVLFSKGFFHRGVKSWGCVVKG